MNRFTIFGFRLGLVLLVSSPIPLNTRAADAPTAAEVDAAIARGVENLRNRQERAGGWSYSSNGDHALGITALAGLALLENSVDPANPTLVSANDVVQRLAVRSNQTYDLALAILFLARFQEGRTGSNDALIRRLARRLEGGENGGMWSYTVPAVDEQGGQARKTRGRNPRNSRAGDNSNTQFALLGIWAAGRHGFDSNAALESINDHFRSSQNDDGRWGYVPGDGGKNAMTCAGLMGLAIAAARPSLAERQSARARGAALAADKAFASALAAVTNDAVDIGRRSEVYYLWSLERVCVALGLRDLDGLDWYAVGARELLRRQNHDGGWPRDRWDDLPNTCLALLFLRKANLAFELDRVLRLPGASRTQAAEVVDEPSPREQTPSGDATVVVTGAAEARFPEIAVDFEVKRSDGSFVLDATREDFRVTEEGRSVPVLRLQSPLTREARPITAVLVVDRSLSMLEENRIAGLRLAVATFLKGLPQGSRVAVVAFGSEVELVSPFTGDFASVQAAVEGLRPAGATRYYDAVAESLALIDHETGRRAVLALTDGEDTFSQTATLESVIASARRLGVPVHALGLGSDDEIESEALRRLAAGTRGQYYSARQADQLRQIYEQLAERLRSSYTLVYQTERKIPDGTLRPVQVFYRAASKAGETAVFIPGTVVPASGWPRLFVALVVGILAVNFAIDRLDTRGKPSASRGR